MKFWIFMNIMTLLCPFIMITFGLLFKKRAPKEINNFFGYRTARSMKNNHTWEFAHNHFGNLWLKLGIGLFIFSSISMLFVIKKSLEVISIFSLIILMIDFIGMIIPIFLTEKKLKQTFDKQGNIN